MLSNRRSHRGKWKTDEIQHQSPMKETVEVSNVKKASKHKGVCSNVLAASICVHLHMAEGKVDYKRIMFLHSAAQLGQCGQSQRKDAAALWRC